MEGVSLICQVLVDFLGSGCIGLLAAQDKGRN
jgi:hypothetical protein